MSQEISYFDKTENNKSVLTDLLKSEAASVQGATGLKIGNMLQSITSLGVCLIIAFYFSILSSLFIVCFLILIIFFGYIQFQLQKRTTITNEVNLKKARKIAEESINKIRTVLILNKEKRIYCNNINMAHKREIKIAHFVGIIHGLANAALLFAMITVFSFGKNATMENNQSAFKNTLYAFFSSDRSFYARFYKSKF